MRNKYFILLSKIIITAIFLSGCSGAAAATLSASNDLSSATRLALGTLNLEGTNQAVTPSQSMELLTLWQAYQSLSQSDTSSQAEIDGLVKQIQSVMTSDQLKAIEAMNLTDQAINEAVQSLGSNTVTSTSASKPGTLTSNQGAQSGGPGGMPAEGGGGVMGDITGSMLAQATPATTQPAASTQPTQVDVRLLDALIQLLASRSQATG